MTVILLDGGIWDKINVLTSNFILLGGNYRPKCYVISFYSLHMGPK